MPNPGELAFAYFVARQYDKAIELYRKGIEKKPDNAQAHILLGEVYVAKGMPAEGVAEMQKGMALDATLDKTPERWDRYPLLAYAYAAAGWRDEAQKILELGNGLDLWKVHPSTLREQDVNARSMPKAMFERLAQTLARDPDNVAPLAVFLASDAAARVNGQVFHSFGYGYALMAPPQPIRRLEADRRIDPEELVKLFPETLGRDLQDPIGTNFGKGLEERPKAEWKSVAGGVRFWQAPWEGR